MHNKIISESNTELTEYKTELFSLKKQAFQNQSKNNIQGRNKNDIEAEELLMTLDTAKQFNKETEKLVGIKEKLMYDVKQYLIKHDTKMSSTIASLGVYYHTLKERNEINTNYKYIEIAKLDYLQNNGSNTYYIIYN